MFEMRMLFRSNRRYHTDYDNTNKFIKRDLNNIYTRRMAVNFLPSVFKQTKPG